MIFDSNGAAPPSGLRRVFHHALGIVTLAASALACSSHEDAAPDGGVEGTDAGRCSGGDSGSMGDATSPGADAGGGALPTLTDLAVTLGDSSTAALVPRFSSDVTDYYVTCAAGSNSLHVTAKAPSGAKASLSLETPAAASVMKPIGGAAQELAQTVTAVEGQAVVTTATRGGSSQEYWVRCLPHDFAQMEWRVQENRCARTPGYYLLGNNWPVTGQTAAYAMVLDANGVPVWYSRQTEDVTGEGVYDIDSLAPGQISFLASPSSLPWEIDGLSPVTTTGIGSGGVLLDNHELQRLPNGDYLFFEIPIETGVDLSGLSLNTGESLGSNSNIASCRIVEVTPANDVVWTWDVADHFDPAMVTVYATTGAGDWHAPDGGPVYDVFHCNSIDIDEETNLLVSARNMDSVFYVERASGKVLWKMGGATASKDSAAYVPVSDAFHRQHDARLLPGWSTRCGGHGQVSMFDDESESTRPARGVIYDVDVGVTGADGSSCATPGGNTVWQYSGTRPSEYMGSFRVTSGGTRIIDWGTGGQTGLVFTEVDSGGHDLLDLVFMPGGSSYRTVKLPPSAFSLSALRKASAASARIDAR